jgi:hypothetical protein
MYPPICRTLMPRAMSGFLMKDMHFSRETTDVGTSRWVSKHRQIVCYIMVNSVCHSDGQEPSATPP